MKESEPEKHQEPLAPPTDPSLNDPPSSLPVASTEKSFPLQIRTSLHFLQTKFTDLGYTRFVFLISSLSVRYKIASSLIATLALAIASLGFVTFSRQKSILEQETKKRAGVLVQQLANQGKESLLTKEEFSSFAFIQEIQKHPGLAYSMILDKDGNVFAHHLMQMKGKLLSDEITRNALHSDKLLFQRVDFEGEPILDASVPVVFKLKNIRLGTARIGLSLRELDQEIRKQKMIYFWISLVFVAIGLLISFGLAKILTRPIYNLVMAMQVVAQGDLSHQVKVLYKDEIGRLSESFNDMILSLREKLHMEKYLSFATLDTIRKHRSEKLKLGGERKYVTALFSDVRGFTSLSEKIRPEEVVELLNVYLNFQSKIVHECKGMVDKFVGDEVMAIFEERGQELQAVRAAVEIQRYCEVLNWARQLTGKKQMLLGIGLNSGDAIMGNMGSEDQMNYTAIGDTINLGARLCGVAKAGQVVISKTIADTIHKKAKLKKLEPVSVKGKIKPIEIYEVLDIEGASRRHMRRAVEISAGYCLAGLETEKKTAIARNISALGCLLETELPVAVGAQIELEIQLELHSSALLLPAVVRHVRKTGSSYAVGVHFHNITDMHQGRLIEWVHRVESHVSEVLSQIVAT